MNKGTSSDQRPNKVNLDCAGGGCCPDVEFLDDGTVVLSEHGEQVKMTRTSAAKLAHELRIRGYT